MPLPLRGCNITQSTCDALSRTGHGHVSPPRPRCGNTCCSKPHRAGPQRRVDIESLTLLSSALIRETTASLNTTQSHNRRLHRSLNAWPPDGLRSSRSPHRPRWLERVTCASFFTSSTSLVLYCDSNLIHALLFNTIHVILLGLFLLLLSFFISFGSLCIST